jgi:hypothetical protein
MQDDPKKLFPRPETAAAQPDHLLDELTSIRALLDGEQRAALKPEDIPVLDDVVGFGVSAPQPPLLDLERIFGDEFAAGDDEPDSGAAHLAFPKFTLDVALSDAPAAPASTHRDARAALIDELVAEFLPQIEATLRARLERLDHAALQALQKPE